MSSNPMPLAPTSSSVGSLQPIAPQQEVKGGGILGWVKLKIFRSAGEESNCNVSHATRANAAAAKAAASAAAAKATVSAASALVVANPSSAAAIRASVVAVESDVLASALSTDATAAANGVPNLLTAISASAAASAIAATATAAVVAATASPGDALAEVAAEEAAIAETAAKAEAAAKAAEATKADVVGINTIFRIEGYAAAAAAAAAHAQVNASAPPDMEPGVGYITCNGLLSCRTKIEPSVANVVKYLVAVAILGALTLFIMKIVYDGKQMFEKTNYVFNGKGK